MHTVLAVILKQLRFAMVLMLKKEEVAHCVLKVKAQEMLLYVVVGKVTTNRIATVAITTKKSTSMRCFIIFSYLIF